MCTPISFSIVWNICTSLGVTKLMASPCRPFLAVLPTRWMQSATVRGRLQLSTRLTSEMSSPREVRSVVTRILAPSLRNTERLATRWLFFMNEWSWVAGKDSFSRVSQMRVHSLQVLTKTMILKPRQAQRIWSKYPGFSSSGVKMQLWVSVFTVFLPWKVVCFTKSSFSPSIYCSFAPSKCSSIVAVANKTCLRLDICSVMLRILGSSRSSNNRSASSRTNTSTRLSSQTNLGDFSIISASLPGVATRMWGQFSNCSCWIRQLTPPTKRACLKFMAWPKIAIC